MKNHQDLYAIEWEINEKLRRIKTTVDEINELRLKLERIEIELKKR